MSAQSSRCVCFQAPACQPWAFCAPTPAAQAAALPPRSFRLAPPPSDPCCCAPAPPPPPPAQAVVRHFHETMTSAMKRSTEMDDGKVDSLAYILHNSKLVSTKPDYRFPNQNQLNNCWQTMNEFQVCAEQKGKGDVACLQKARDYLSVCPQKWVEVSVALHAQGPRAEVHAPQPACCPCWRPAHAFFFPASPALLPPPLCALAGLEGAGRRGPQHYCGQGVLLDYLCFVLLLMPLSPPPPPPPPALSLSLTTPATAAPCRQRQR